MAVFQNGKSAIDIAVEKRYKEMIEVLTTYSSKVRCTSLMHYDWHKGRVVAINACRNKSILRQTICQQCIVTIIWQLSSKITVLILFQIFKDKQKKVTLLLKCMANE